MEIVVAGQNAILNELIPDFLRTDEPLVVNALVIRNVDVSPNGNLSLELSLVLLQISGLLKTPTRLELNMILNLVF